MHRRALVVVASLGVCAALGIAVACSDSGLGPSHSDASRVTRSQFSRVPGRAPITPAEFDRRNPMHWVGVLHNRGVDVARARMRAHSLHLRDYCRELPGILAKDFATVPGAGTEADIARQTRQYLATLPSCRTLSVSSNDAVPRQSGLARPASTLLAGVTMDDADVANSLMAAIGTAANSATNATSFAPVLDSITTLADGLDSLSRSAVYGTAAVAMSSAEYWDENMTSYAYEVERDYCDTEVADPSTGPCLEVPYSLVAPVALPAMMQTNWGNVGKVVGADVGTLAAGGIAGLLLWAWDWPVIAAGAAGASFVAAAAIIIKWYFRF